MIPLPLLAFLSLLSHVEARVGTTRPRPAPARSPHPSTRRPVDNATRVHVDGSHRRDRWVYRDEACGWVLEGLPSTNRLGQPAGIALDTIERLWPLRTDNDTLLRIIDPRAAEDARRCRQFRSVRR